MQEWDEDKFTASARQGYRLEVGKVAEFETHTYFAMKRLTAGVTRKILDTSKTAGEAWYPPTVSTEGMSKAQPTLPANSKS